jgi:hypothetical protein
MSRRSHQDKSKPAAAAAAPPVEVPPVAAELTAGDAAALADQVAGEQLEQGEVSFTPEEEAGAIAELEAAGSPPDPGAAPPPPAPEEVEVVAEPEEEPAADERPEDPTQSVSAVGVQRWEPGCGYSAGARVVADYHLRAGTLRACLFERLPGSGALAPGDEGWTRAWRLIALAST